MTSFSWNIPALAPGGLTGAGVNRWKCIRYILSSVATDALVLKHQGIGIHSAE